MGNSRQQAHCDSETDHEEQSSSRYNVTLRQTMGDSHQQVHCDSDEHVSTSRIESQI